jgi:alkylhydroperoxidase family enzyme
MVILVVIVPFAGRLAVTSRALGKTSHAEQKTFIAFAIGTNMCPRLPSVPSRAARVFRETIQFRIRQVAPVAAFSPQWKNNTMVIHRFFIFLILSMLWKSPLGVAQSATGIGGPAAEDRHSLLSAFVSYTDLRIRSVQRNLEILAATTEVRSGNWSTMKNLLRGYQESDEGLTVWHSNPDGTYYTADKGLMDTNLSDRTYFPDLMAGTKITGALVISKATGQRSAIIAVPVEVDGKVAGAVGVSLFLDKLSEQVSAALDLRPGVAFYALAPSGLTTLHHKMDRHFLDPRELGSETLKKAATEMLAGTTGKVSYEFDDVTKTAIYWRSALTGWVFAIAFSATPVEIHGGRRITFPNEPNSRISPLSTDDLRPEWEEILRRLPGKGLKGEGFPRNLLGVLMQNQETLGPFLDYWVTSKSKMGLTIREQELVILRMAVLYRSEYVWKHHVKVGREFGINDTELDAVRLGSYKTMALERERALLQLTDAFMNERFLSPELWSTTRGVLRSQDFVDLISLVSQYVLFGLTNVCMQVQVEPGVADLPGIEK